MTPSDRSIVDYFMEGQQQVAAAHGRSTFSYIALLRDKEFRLHRGRLNLGGAPTLPSPDRVQSTHVRAGVFYLSQVDMDAGSFIRALENGSINTPHGPLHFPTGPSGKLSASIDPIHKDGLAWRSRFAVLTISA